VNNRVVVRGAGPHDQKTRALAELLSPLAGDSVEALLERMSGRDAWILDVEDRRLGDQIAAAVHRRFGLPTSTVPSIGRAATYAADLLEALEHEEEAPRVVEEPVAAPELPVAVPEITVPAPIEDAPAPAETSWPAAPELARERPVPRPPPPSERPAWTPPPPPAPDVDYEAVALGRIRRASITGAIITTLGVMGSAIQGNKVMFLAFAIQGLLVYGIVRRSRVCAFLVAGLVLLVSVLGLASPLLPVSALTLVVIGALNWFYLWGAQGTLDYHRIREQLR